MFASCVQYIYFYWCDLNGVTRQSRACGSEDVTSQAFIVPFAIWEDGECLYPGYYLIKFVQTWKI